MRVRSQDKLILVDNPTVFIDIYYTNHNGLYHNSLCALKNKEEVWILGQYKTKERCIEILDLIQSYADNQAVRTFIMPEE